MRRLAFLALLVCLAASSRLRAAPWIVITELHYNPPGGDDDEFIELLSREPPRVDLTGWAVEGETDFRFPEGTSLRAGEYIVLARDPGHFHERHPGAGRVLGPLKRALDNGGGRITLRNASGAVAHEVHYGTRGKWPTTPDGTGHTLSLLDPYLDPADPRNWAPSAKVGGTPGAPNFPRGQAQGRLLVPKGAIWRYKDGRDNLPATWREPAYDDSAWKSGPSGFGYGDDDDATVIDDMMGKYFTLYTRRAFAIPEPASLGRLILRVDYDDGFVAYLNGKEIARASMGPEGSPTAADQPSKGKHEAGVPAEFDLGRAAERLTAGRNVLAVEVHNDNLTSSDLSLIVELEERAIGSDSSGRRAAPPLINEVSFASPDAAFVEVYNPGAADLPLGGWSITDDPRDLRKLRIPPSCVVKPRGFLALSRKELGEKLDLRGPAVFVALVEPAGDRVADALHVGEKPPKQEKDKDKAKEKGKEKPKPERKGGGNGGETSAARPYGRFPDGSTDVVVLDAATPGEPNRAAVATDVVINEVLYNSITGSEADEFLELHNRGSEPVSLEGFRLAGAVKLAFAAGASIGPGKFLVAAKDPAALGRKYGLARDVLVGPYEGSLSGRGDEIVLRDPLGRVADRVAYADRDPWPRWADGLGSSLELIDPQLDNSLPSAWAASDSSGEAKWQTFSHVKDHRAFEGHNLSEVQFLLIGEGECLIDDVRVGDVIADNFEKGAEGWTALGTHERSGPFREGAGGGKGCYRIVADGRGNARQNYVSRTVPRGLVPGKKYQVSFRAKWLRGFPVLLVRTPGQGVSKAHVLPVPARIGTPGAANGASSRLPPLAIGALVQTPIVPESNAPVEIGVRISGRAAIGTALIHYRDARTTEWRTAPLADAGGEHDALAGDGNFGGQIPGLPAGKVSFYITAEDAGGKTAVFPRGAPDRTAMYAVGILPSKRFPTITLLVADEALGPESNRPRMSNRPIDATLVFGDSRIYYDVGLRLRGSPFTRGARNWRVIFGADTLDGRGTLTLDGQGGDGTKLNERLTYWLADQLLAPNARQEYVYFRLLGHEEGVYEDVEKIDRSYLDRWFQPRESAAPGPAASAAAASRKKLPARLHKIDDYWELASGGEQAYREANFAFKTQDPEDYRWNFPERANSAEEDYVPLMKLVRFLDPAATPARPFAEGLEKMLDADEWARVLAARRIADDWDTMGGERGKNAFLYLSPWDGRWRLLPWDCDLAWRDPRSALISPKFQGVQRLLEEPGIRRRFFGYLYCLAERAFSPERIGAAMADLKAYSGAATKHFEDFARERRTFVLSQVPKRPFQVASVKRIERSKEPDVVRAAGLAPPAVMRMRLDGRQGALKLVGAEEWSADFPVGPEGGDLALEALDFGGGEVARVTVKVRSRAGAIPLPEGDNVVAVNRTPSAAASTAGLAEEAPLEPAVPPTQPPAPAGETSTDLVARVEKSRKVEGAPEKHEGAPAPAASGAPAAVETVRAAPSGSDSPSAKEEAIEREPSRSVDASASRPPLPWTIVLVLGCGGALVMVGGLLTLRRRGGEGAAPVRARRPAAAPRAPAVKASATTAVVGPVERLRVLGGADFDIAAEALASLSCAGEEAIPPLLDALADDRLTPFQKVRGGAKGLSAVRVEGKAAIRVRHIAALLLERAIGRPPVAKPSRADWEARWREGSE